MMKITSQIFKKSGRAGAAKSGKNSPARLLLHGLAILFFVAQLNSATAAEGVSTVGEYAARLVRAKQAIDEVIEQESPAPALVERMNAVKRLLPAREEVESGGSIVRVDNAWLHEAADSVIKNADGDIEQRHSMLREMADRLVNLQQRVKESQNQVASTSQDQRARLESILARAEYQPEEKRESIVQRWIRKLKEDILRLLERLFGGSSARDAPGSAAGLVVVVRILILLLVVAALVFGVIKLAQRWERRRKSKEEPETREVLGEEIAEDSTAADLLARAAELARQGEYRRAIRRAYIALLIELEQRDKLRLHRSKTNRDYLDALRAEQRIYPPFSAMTNSFERVWYGEQRATAEQFNDFVALYRKTAG
jgi:large-conductance mechanosensitive channel